MPAIHTCLDIFDTTMFGEPLFHNRLMLLSPVVLEFVLGHALSTMRKHGET